MPTVKEKLADPSGTALTGGAVLWTVELFATSSGHGANKDDAATPVTRIGSWRAVPDAAGLVSLDLKANALISPTGTYYRRTLQVGAATVRDAFVVPNGAGPYNLYDILVAAPATVAAFLSDTAPVALATVADAGDGTKAARDDHAHPLTGIATDAELAAHAALATAHSQIGRASGSVVVNADGSVTVTTPAGASGNTAGSDVSIALGAGAGTGRTGRVRITGSETVATGAGDHGLLELRATLAPAAAMVSSYECLHTILTIASGGANLTGAPAVESAQMVSYYDATDTMAATLYGAESTVEIRSTGNHTGTATGFQGNVRSSGTGAFSLAVGVRSAIGPFTGAVASATGFLVVLDLAGTGKATTVIGFDSPIVGATPGRSDAAGGYSVYGAQLSIPSQGGNTSGTVFNAALYASNTHSPNAGGGSPGAGGGVNNIGVKIDIPIGASNPAGGTTINNYGFWVDVTASPTSPFGTVNSYGGYIKLPQTGRGAAGTVTNYGLRITGAGGSVGVITNWALYIDSTKDNVIAGPLTLGATAAPTASSLTLADAWNIVVNTTTGSKIGTATGQKLGFWGATPVVQQVLATGAGATVDNVISLLQTLGLCKQS